MTPTSRFVCVPSLSPRRRRRLLQTGFPVTQRRRRRRRRRPAPVTFPPREGKLVSEDVVLYYDYIYIVVYSICIYRTYLRPLLLLPQYYYHNYYTTTTTTITTITTTCYFSIYILRRRKKNYFKTTATHRLLRFEPHRAQYRYLYIIICVYRYYILL